MSSAAFVSQQLFGPAVEPADGTIGPDGDDAHRDGLQQVFGQRLLDGQAFMQQGIFDGDGYLLGQERQLFDVARLERGAGGGAADTQPADQVLASEKRQDGFRAGQIEGLLEQPALFHGLDMAQHGARQAVCVKLEPLDKGMRLRKLQRPGFLHALDSGAETIDSGRRDRKDRHPGNTGATGHPLDDAFEHDADVVEPAERAGKMVERRRDVFARRGRRHHGVMEAFLQHAVFLLEPQMRLGLVEQRLQPQAVDIARLDGIDPLCGRPQARIGPGRAQRDDHDVRKSMGEFRQDRQAVRRAQVHEKQGVVVVVQQQFELGPIADVPHRRTGMEESADALEQRFVLRIEETGRECAHGDTCSGGVHSGNCTWKTEPLPCSLSTSIVPPCSRMMPCDTERPIPTPLSLVVKNGSKILLRAARIDAAPGILHIELDAVAVRQAGDLRGLR